MNISITWTIALIVVMILFMTIQITQKNINSTNENGSPFECGLNVMSPSHIPFSFQFFLVALLFLIFDVEIAIILSYPIESTSTNNITAIFSFLIVLTIGLIYEWQNGNIEWSN